MTATYTVKHPRLYLRVNGKLQHVPQGTPLTLSEKQVKALGSKIEAAKTTEAVAISDTEEAQPAAPDDITEDTERQPRRGRPPKSEAI